MMNKTFIFSQLKHMEFIEEAKEKHLFLFVGSTKIYLSVFDLDVIIKFMENPVIHIDSRVIGELADVERFFSTFMQSEEKVQCMENIIFGSDFVGSPHKIYEEYRKYLKELCDKKNEIKNTKKSGKLPNKKTIAKRTTHLPSVNKPNTTLLTKKTPTTEPTKNGKVEDVHVPCLQKKIPISINKKTAQKGVEHMKPIISTKTIKKPTKSSSTKNTILKQKNDNIVINQESSSVGAPASTSSAVDPFDFEKYKHEYDILSKFYTGMNLHIRMYIFINKKYVQVTKKSEIDVINRLETKGEFLDNFTMELNVYDFVCAWYKHFKPENLDKVDKYYTVYKFHLPKLLNDMYNKYYDRNSKEETFSSWIYP